jgi:hypothetical protein
MSVRKSLALAITAAGAAAIANPAHAQLASGIPQWAGPYVGITGGGGWGDIKARAVGFCICPAQARVAPQAVFWLGMGAARFAKLKPPTAVTTCPAG